MHVFRVAILGLSTLFGACTIFAQSGGGPERVHVLSLHTLSTPHHGSILADLSVLRRKSRFIDVVQPEVDYYFELDQFAENMNFGPGGDGLENVTTGYMKYFNELPTPIPPDVRLYTYCGNADADQSHVTPDDRCISKAEFAGQADVEGILEVIQEVITLAGSIFAAPTLYHILGRREQAKVRKDVDANGSNPVYIVEIPFVGAPFRKNDLFVRDEAAQFTGAVSHNAGLTMQLGKNHSRMRDRSVMTLVVLQIQQEFPLLVLKAQEEQ